MSIFSFISSKIKEILANMKGKKTIESTLNVTTSISSQMENAILLWHRMYKNDAPWLHEPTPDNATRIVSLGLPALISSEKARMALLEWQSEITDPNKDVNTDVKKMSEDITTRAGYLNLQYKKLKKHIRRQAEYGIAKGGLVIKPYIVMNNKSSVKTTTIEDGNKVVNIDKPAIDMEFDYIQADNFYPCAFDANGKITEAVFVQSKVDNDIIYRRLEYHKWENNSVTVINKAFKAVKSKGAAIESELELGKEIPLTEVNEWAALSPEVKIDNVDRPLFAYFKMPEANTIDTLSPLGVSGFSRVVNLIKDADMQYSRLLWEYEGGELAINIDRDALREDVTDTGYHSVNPMLQQRLYRKVDLGAENNTYEPFAPTLRDNSYIGGLNSILMHIEDATGLSRGTLSDVGIEAKTATEIKILKQRSYSTNKEIQTALQYALEDVIYIMNVYCDLYNIVPSGEYDVSFEWDDSILVDMDTELNRRLSLQQNGLTSKLENRMWYFGETKRQAMLALELIKEENEQLIKDNMELQASLGKDFQSSTAQDDTSPEDKKSKEQKELTKKDTMDNERPLKDPKDTK